MPIALPSKILLLECCYTRASFTPFLATCNAVLDKDADLYINMKAAMRNWKCHSAERLAGITSPDAACPFYNNRAMSFLKRIPQWNEQIHQRSHHPNSKQVKTHCEQLKVMVQCYSIWYKRLSTLFCNHFLSGALLSKLKIPATYIEQSA